MLRARFKVQSIEQKTGPGHDPDDPLRMYTAELRTVVLVPVPVRPRSDVCRAWGGYPRGEVTLGPMGLEAAALFEVGAAYQIEVTRLEGPH